MATQQISIFMDGVWVGSGRLRDGTIEDCGAQFCSDNEESLDIYEMLEDAIEAGSESMPAQFSGSNDIHQITWTIV